MDPRVMVLTDETLLGMLGPSVTIDNLLQHVWDVRSMQEIESAVAALPRPLIAKLAEGPAEEPGCRLCQSVKEEIPDPDALPEHVVEAGRVLLDFHEFSNEQVAPFLMAFEKAPAYMTELAHHFIGTMVYTRCQLIYTTARKIIVAAP